MKDPGSLFYRRPRLLVLTLLLVFVSGLAAFTQLPRAEDPVLRGRLAQIVTRLPGASPARVEALVTEKIEAELQEVAGLETVFSQSRRGVSIIMAELADEVSDPGPVFAELRDRVDDARPLLPPDAGEPEFTENKIEAFTVIAALRWLGPPRATPRGSLRRLAENLQDRMRQLHGTEDVELFGAVEEEVEVTVSPETLVALGRSASDLARATRGADPKVAAGQRFGARNDLGVEVAGELRSLERIRAVPIRQGADGRVVRLGDVARVQKVVRDPPDELAVIDGAPAVVVAARMQPGRRVDRWSDGARAALAEFARGLPADVALELIFDQSRYTAARMNGLRDNLLLGVALVALVMLFMMGWRSSLLVGISLPTTMLMALTGLWFMRVPLHQMSVTGLIIALGLLIDNAIVMVDEVQHRLDVGAPPAEAIAGAVRHLAVPLGSSTLTTALAFMPMILMAGPAGEFVGGIGLSVILALTASLFLALTVIPSVFARGTSPERGAAWWSRGLTLPAAASALRRLLDRLVARPLRGVAIGGLLPLVGFVATLGLPEQFFPPADRDQLQVNLRLHSHASLAETERATARVRDVLLEHPEVEAVYWFLGRASPKFFYNMLSGNNGVPSFAQGLIKLKASDLESSLVRRLQVAIDRALPDAQVIVKQLEQGPPVPAPIELHIYGPDLDTLRQLAEEARGVLARIPRVVATRSTLEAAQPKVVVEASEEDARLVGLDGVTIARQLDAALRGAVGGSLVEETEELPIRIRVRSEPGSAASIGGIALLAGAPAPSPNTPARAVLPVAALGELRLEPQLGAITHRGGRRVATVQGYVEAGVLASAVLTDYQRELTAAGLAPPPGYRFEVGGESKERDRAVSNLLASAGILLVLMAASLVLSFDSFRQAGIIVAVGVQAVGLAMAALWMFGEPFGFMAIIGTMGLIGVAINDSIVVLAGIRADPVASTGDGGAIVDVVMRSSRHVIATTVTTVAGFVPLLVLGGDFWRPLAISIGGGVAGATLLALTFVPCAYKLLSDLGMRCDPACEPAA